MKCLHRQLIVGKGQCQLLRVGEAEMRRNQLAQGRRRSPTVTCADCSPESSKADRIAPTPVTCHLPQSQEPLLPTIRMHADGVDACTRDERDAPTLGGTRPKRGQRVVAYLDAPAQVPSRELVQCLGL